MRTRKVLLNVTLSASPRNEASGPSDVSAAMKVSRAVCRPNPPGSSDADTKTNVSSGEIASRRAERRPTLSAERYLDWGEEGRLALIGW